VRFFRILLPLFAIALIVVPSALAIRFTDDSYNMPTGVVGQPYSKQFNGAGGCGPALPYQYTLISGQLPPGLSLSFSGLISGTPTQAGSFSFYVNLSDQNPPTADWCRPAASQRQFAITVVGGGGTATTPLKIQQTSLNPSTSLVNHAYRFQFSASGGGSQTWSLKSGLLPGGITLSSNGVLSGTPTAAGTFTFDVQVSDGSRSDAHTYTLVVVQGLKIAALKAPPAEVSRPFALQLAAAGGKPTYKWALAAGTALPAGLTLDTATGAITGTPTQAGTFAFKVGVTDSLGLTDSVEAQLIVANRLATTSRVVTLKLGRRLHVSLRATGGVLPRTWKLVGGSLPAGIRFAQGQLVGKPKHAGASTITLQVRDALGAVATARITLRVLPHA
jgi:hypothetical protein